MNTLLFKLKKSDKVGIALFAIFIVLTLASLYQIAQGRSTDLRSDLVVADEATQDNVAVHLFLSSLTAATSTVLVDLSDTTNFPHKLTGNIEVAQIRIEWDATTTATTSLRFGLIASSSVTQALNDIFWFDNARFNTETANVTTRESRKSKVINYAPGVLKLNVSGGVPSAFLTNEKQLLSSTFATSTKLSSPLGVSDVTTNASVLVNPAVGDLLMQVSEQSGIATTSVTVIYRVR